MSPLTGVPQGKDIKTLRGKNMGKKLYVGNLPYSITENELANLFSEAGSVASAVIINDRQSGRSKGFGFVEMSTDEEAQKAVEMLNGRQVSGRDIVVNEARPLEDRRGGSGPGGFRGGHRRHSGDSRRPY